MGVIPLEDFFRKPEVAHLRLSPGGTHLAWLAPFERRFNVFVKDLRTGEVRRVTSVTDRDLSGFTWANDDRLVYARDQGGDENYRLYAVGRDGSDPLDLTPFPGVKCGIVDDLEEVPDQVLIQMNRRRKDYFDVHRLDVRTGQMTLEAENPGNVQAWVTDHAGRVRVAVTTDGVNSSILHREPGGTQWREVARYDFRERALPELFSFDNRFLYVSSSVGRDTTALCEYDLATGEETRVLYQHPEVDFLSVLSSKHRKVVTGVSYETDRLGYHFLDEERRKIQEFLDRELPGRDNRVTSASRDEARRIVHSGSDRSRGSYHLLECPAGGPWKLTHLFELSPWLPEEELAEMQPIEYAARDGLRIRGYLTRPRRRDASRPPPLLVHPHGGPWARDSFGFNPEIQFLANRGHAVLQMNFRGSAGFGRRFREAGYGEWGRAMQDDVTDAAAWAIAAGHAERGRIGIYGGSYGGYATLMGLCRTPELYACGISYVGISNLFTWIRSIPPYWTPFLDMMYEMVGHPERDRARFEETSPLFQAHRIRVPLFVAQGANDPRVPKQESDQIVAALKQRGIPVEYLVKDNEGHGFQNEENTFEFYRAMEAFLARYLPAEPEPR